MRFKLCLSPDRSPSYVLRITVISYFEVRHLIASGIFSPIAFSPPQTDLQKSYYKSYRSSKIVLYPHRSVIYEQIIELIWFKNDTMNHESDTEKDITGTLPSTLVVTPGASTVKKGNKEPGTIEEGRLERRRSRSRGRGRSRRSRSRSRSRSRRSRNSTSQSRSRNRSCRSSSRRRKRNSSGRRRDSSSSSVSSDTSDDSISSGSISSHDNKDAFVGCKSNEKLEFEPTMQSSKISPSSHGQKRRRWKKKYFGRKKHTPMVNVVINNHSPYPPLMNGATLSENPTFLVVATPACVETVSNLLSTKQMMVVSNPVSSVKDTITG